MAIVESGIMTALPITLRKTHRQLFHGSTRLFLLRRHLLMVPKDDLSQLRWQLLKWRHGLIRIDPPIDALGIPVVGAVELVDEFTITTLGYQLITRSLIADL